MDLGHKKLPARFYETPAGNEPVRAWLLALDTADRQRVGTDIAKVEFGWPIGMPYCRSLSGGLWEVRSDISNGRTARVLFAIINAEMVLLHAFVKKTQATPRDDLELARKRMKEVQ
jgi:phage-related protein